MLNEQVKEKEVTYYIGIDISKKKLDIMWLKDPKSGKGKPKVFPNTHRGHQETAAWLMKQIGCEFNEMHVVMESTSIYHEALAYHLHGQGICVSVVNPMKTHHFAKSLVFSQKTDKKDSMMLAKYGLAVQPEAWQPEPENVRQLKALCNRLDTLNEDLRREENRREKLLHTQSDKQVLDSSARTIDFLNSEIALLKQRIDDHIDQDPMLKKDYELLTSIPGVGAVNAHAMQALLRSRTFISAKQVASYLGLVPKHRESGEVRGKTTLSKSGSSVIRSKLYMASVVSIRYNPELRVFYESLLERGKAKKQAICAVMRKLVHICYGVIKHQSKYQPQVM